MRRSVVATMSGVSLVVVGLSLRASGTGPHTVVAGTAAVGVVAAAPPAPAAPATAAATRRAAARRHTASPSAAATRAAARRAVQQQVRTSAPSPAARRTTSAPAPKPTSQQTYTVTGPAEESGYGPVQVQVQIRGRRIVTANAIEYPQGSTTDQYKNSYAIPQLDQETLQAQSAHIDTVSGATYTSQAYIASLQAALDQAHQAGIF